MTALRAHQPGGPEVLLVESAPVPMPADDEVLVAVRSAAITFDELTWVETWTRDGVSRTPTIPSHEVSGVIADIGSGVTDFRPGDEVYGLIRFDRDGAAAQYVTVPAADLATRPMTVSHTVAAALPLAGLTALQALVDHAKVQPGEDVLVLGAAGGVGALAVQLANILGANVTATVRSDTGDLVRDFGAKRVIDVRSRSVRRWRARLRRRHRHRRWRDTGPLLFGATSRRSADHPVCAPSRRQGRRIRRHGNIFHRDAKSTTARRACRPGGSRPAAR